ncbi:unnamed protein product [Mytilus edulis]|uniref:CCHC-type domain-containing protein n=1 Tax=Mytilus edulis TaxID=6550 RepID=A0A8S3SJG9_MYTED|nr:unnamed protein product [Mytilus edulis]
MSNQQSENPDNDKIATSYVLVLKQNNNNFSKDNAEPDGEYFSVKPVFILESDIFANHLNGLQRVIGGVWRIYPDNEKDRDTLVVNSITIRKKRIEVYPRNPKYLEKEHPTTDIKNCSNDWKCKTCGANGHISRNCISEFDQNSQIVSEESTEESGEESVNESEKDDEIVSSQSTENHLHTDDIPQNEQNSKITELTKDISKVDEPEQNLSQLKSEAPIEQSPEQN